MAHRVRNGHTPPPPLRANSTRPGFQTYPPIKLSIIPPLLPRAASYPLVHMLTIYDLLGKQFDPFLSIFGTARRMRRDPHPEVPCVPSRRLLSRPTAVRQASAGGSSAMPPRSHPSHVPFAPSSRSYRRTLVCVAHTTSPKPHSHALLAPSSPSRPSSSRPLRAALSTLSLSRCLADP